MSDEDGKKMEEIRKFSAIYGRFDAKRKQDKPLTLHEVHRVTQINSRQQRFSPRFLLTRPRPRSAARSRPCSPGGTSSSPWPGRWSGTRGISTARVTPGRTHYKVYRLLHNTHRLKNETNTVNQYRNQSKCVIYSEHEAHNFVLSGPPSQYQTSCSMETRAPSSG